MPETTAANVTIHTLDLTALFTEIQRLRDSATYPHDIGPEIVEQCYHLIDLRPDAETVELIWIDLGEGEPPIESVQVTPRT